VGRCRCDDDDGAVSLGGGNGLDARDAGRNGRGGLAGDSAGGSHRVAAAVRHGRRARGHVGVALGALGDAELGAVLVLAGDVVDELESVAGVAGGGLERGRGGPDEGAAVGDADDDGGTLLDDVGRGALEEEERHAVGGRWLPRDGEGLAGGDNLELRLASGFPRSTARAWRCRNNASRVVF
jgi:hypothetical protein